MYQRVILRLSASTLVIRRRCPVGLVLHKSAMQSVRLYEYHEYQLAKFCFRVWKPPFHISVYAPDWGAMLGSYILDNVVIQDDWTVFALERVWSSR